MYSRSAKGGEKGDPNRNPWLAKMVNAIFKISKFLNHQISLILHLVSITFIYIIIRTNGPTFRANVNYSCLTFSLSNNLLVLDSSVDRRTDRIKRNLGNQSVGD